MFRHRLLMAGALALAAAMPVAAEEVIGDVTIGYTLTEPGFFWSDYKVTAEFKIYRDQKPDQDIYFEVYLEETDIGDDEELCPQYPLVETSDWESDGNGGYCTTINVTFPRISDYYGTDWAIDDDDVTEVACKDVVASVGGGFDQLDQNVYIYKYQVENDPIGVAMDPNVGIASISVGSLHQQFNPPLANGEGAMAVFFDSTPPPVDGDLVEEVSTVPYTVTFTNGHVQYGQAIGPAQCLADFNADGQLNILDFVAFQAAFINGAPSADINNDGVHNILDFVAFQNLFNQGC